MDWSGCSLVVARPGTISGFAALHDDPRFPADAVVENMDCGMTAKEVAEMFNLHTPVRDIQSIYDYAKKMRVPNPV